LFDAVMAGVWRWPDPDGVATAGDPGHLSPAALQKLVNRLQNNLIGERIGRSTWDRTYRLYFTRLLEVAGEKHWPDDRELIETVIRHWPANSRARQMAHDRLRRLWKEASWPWPDGLAELRGNGKAAAAAEGVRAFTDAEIQELRARLQRSRLTPADLVAWDCLIAFGLRPAELQGLELKTDDGLPIARVTRAKRSSKGSSGPRSVPAVAPEGWPADCHELVRRFQEHGLPPGMVAARSPGEVLGQQLGRLMDRQPVEIALPTELTPYGLRHAFALRLGLQLGLHVRESAELMGHSPQVHLSTYGRRLDAPKLLATVRDRVMSR
jgi:integrase